MLTRLELTGCATTHLSELDNKLLVHKALVAPWQALQKAAKAKGFDLQIASGFRSFERQLSIWNRKFNGELAVKDSTGKILDMSALSDEEKIHAIMLYSALPGASRHHWGTDIDIYAPNLLPLGENLQLESWEYQQGGYFAGLNDWLKNNASEFGFFYPYKSYQQGVAAEPWHLSYAPISEGLLTHLSPALLADVLTEQNIAGRAQIKVILPTLFKRYIRNICPPEPRKKPL